MFNRDRALSSVNTFRHPRITRMEVLFKALTWSVDELRDIDNHQETILHVGGMTANQETVHFLVEGFRPFAYLQLPPGIAWNAHHLLALDDRFRELTKRFHFTAEIDMKRSGSLYRYLNKRRVRALVLTFPTMSAMRTFRNILGRTDLVIGGMRFYKGAFTLNELKTVDAIIKYTSQFRLPMAGWIIAKLPEGGGGDEPVATADISARLPCDALSAHPSPETLDHVMITPSFMSMDIETFSWNHDSKDPDSTQEQNVINQIGIVTGRMGVFAIEQRYCLTLGHEATWTDQSYQLLVFPLRLTPDDSEVQRRQKILKAERALLIHFFKMIKQLNPDVFLGYNIMKFDWPYILTRSRRHGILHMLQQCGRVPDMPATLGVMQWESNAYGQQEFEYINMHGRLHMDMMVEIQRNYRYPKYSLNYVSQEVLEEQKDDLTHRELFMIWQFTTDYVDRLASGMTRLQRDAMSKTLTQTLMRNRQTHGIVLKYRNRIIHYATQDRYHYRLVKTATRLMGIMADYCVQDCTLPIRLCQHLNSWQTMISMSQIVCVPISYLSTRGQQVRVVSQVVRECIPERIFIQNEIYPPYRYQGATVIEVNPGHYQDVFTLDFASLYPSEQLSNNLCMSTHLLEEERKALTENEYRVFDIHEHVGCEHDPLHRKKKKEEMYCSDNTFYFRRVKYIIHEDGSYTEESRGIIPRMIQKLLSQRRSVKKQMAFHEQQVDLLKEKIKALNEESDSEVVAELMEKLKLHQAMVTNKNAEQLAIKVSANSIYGSSGTKTGVLSFVPVASIITAMGRKHLMAAIHEIQKLIPKIKLVYGDSVPGSTPILVRNRHTQSVHVMAIRDLFQDQSVYALDDGQGKDSGKEYAALTQWEVWSDLGFTSIHTVMRHHSTKRLYRVTTTSGNVVVTEDHSLLTSEGYALPPTQVSLDQVLMTKDWPVLWETSRRHEWTCYAAKDQRPWAYAVFYRYAYYHEESDAWRVQHTDSSLLLQWCCILQPYLGQLNVHRQTDSTKYHVTLSTLQCRMDPMLLLIMAHGRFPCIPHCITEQSQAFIQGWVDGWVQSDGSHTDRNVAITVPCHYPQVELDVARIVWMIRSLGHAVYPRRSSAGLYILQMARPGYDMVPGTVVQIEVLPATDDYVYDLETENHHFAAGLGNLVVHNTDSAMLIAEGRTRDESYAIAQEVSRIATHKIKCLIVGIETDHQLQSRDGRQRFPIREMTPTSPEFKYLVYEDQCRCIEYHQCPMELVFENMYEQFFLRTKKRYTAYAIDRTGKRKRKTVKGVLTTRRDNCAFTRKVYDDVDEAILANESYEHTMSIIQRHLSLLYSHQLHHSQWVMYKGIKRLMDYANHVKKKDDATKKKGIAYFVDANGDPLVPPPTDPLDPRLVYTNSVQSCLGLKMLRRGMIIPSNYRLEYLYLDVPIIQSDSEKVEDYGYFLEHYKDQGWRPDLDYYAHTLLGSTDDKQVAEMLKIKYPGTIIYDWGPLKNEIPRLLKLWQLSAQDLLPVEAREMLRRIASVQRFVLMSADMEDVPCCERRSCACRHSYQGATWTTTRHWGTLRPGTIVHQSRGFHAKLDAIIALSHDPAHAAWLGLPWPQGCRSLLTLALHYKSHLILKTCHRSKGQDARKLRRGKNPSKNITIASSKRCKMVTARQVGMIPPLTMVWVTSRQEITPKDTDPDDDTVVYPNHDRPHTISDYTYTIMDMAHPDHVVSSVYREDLISYYDTHDRDLQRLIGYYQQWQRVVTMIAQIGSRVT